MARNTTRRQKSTRRASHRTPAPFIGGLTVRFRKVAEPVLDDDGAVIAAASPIPVPPSRSLLSFEKGEFNLDLHIVWSDTDIPHLQVNLAADLNENRYEGVWHEERSGGLTGGRALDLDPRRAEGRRRAGRRQPARPLRRHELPVPTGWKRPLTRCRPNAHWWSMAGTCRQFADRADIRSLSPHISYGPDFRGGEDRHQTIAHGAGKGWDRGPGSARRLHCQGQSGRRGSRPDQNPSRSMVPTAPGRWCSLTRSPGCASSAAPAYPPMCSMRAIPASSRFPTRPICRSGKSASG